MQLTFEKAVKKKTKGGKKGRKIGRNKIKCQQYRISGHRERNKARRIAKDLARKR